VTEFGAAVQELIKSSGTLVIDMDWDLPLTQANAKGLLNNDEAAITFFGISIDHIAK